MSEVIQGDCLDVLKSLPENSVDSLVTDPPAGISFMGKAWDSDKGGSKEWIAWMESVMRECLRVMKPGAHGLVWAIPRTSHWTATALENAGFEIRDVITHLFGQGFPKSLDISKAIDKAAGAEREVIGSNPNARESVMRFNQDGRAKNTALNNPAVTAPATDAAKVWQGWGTALKPASEHWILVRKPCAEKTVAANVLKHGTGGINIDGSRVGSEMRVNPPTGCPGANSGRVHGEDGRNIEKARLYQQKSLQRPPTAVTGRFPANLVLSHHPDCLHVFPTGETDLFCVEGCAVKALDEQSGTLKSGKLKGVYGSMGYHGGASGHEKNYEPNAGGASRFFYCAKVSPSERNAGLEGEPDKVLAFSGGAAAAAARGEEYDNGDGGMNRTRIVKNHHPTVKPLKLMRYLCRMITPPGGTVLDPFAGSGSTGVAAMQEGFKFLGIERDPEYVAIAEKRIYGAFPKMEKQYHVAENVNV